MASSVYSMSPSQYLTITSRFSSTHSRRRAKSCALNSPPTTRTSGRIATEINSEGCTFGPCDTFTRTSCGTPAFGEIQTTNGSPVRLGDRLAISKRASPSGSPANLAGAVCLLAFIGMLPAPQPPFRLAGESACPTLAVFFLQLRQCRRSRAELLEWNLDERFVRSSAQLVQIGDAFVDVQQAGDDFALGLALV
jgi:hypothetical protein